MPESQGLQSLLDWHSLGLVSVKEELELRGDRLLASGRSYFSGLLPPLSRVPHEKDGQDQEHNPGDAEIAHGGGEAVSYLVVVVVVVYLSSLDFESGGLVVGVDEEGRELGENEGAHSEGRDDETSRESSPLGEVVPGTLDWDHVGEAVADAVEATIEESKERGAPGEGRTKKT